MLANVFHWRPSLFTQFFIGVAIMLVPLALVVLVFLQALEKNMHSTQQIVLSSYRNNEASNEIKQLAQSIERATLQNSVLQSEQLEQAIEKQWQKGANLLSGQGQRADDSNLAMRWRALNDTYTQTKERIEQRGKDEKLAPLFEPLRKNLNSHGEWLHQYTKERVEHARQSLSDLQQSFIHWLVALVPIVFLLGGGYLWRISSRLKYLSTVIGRLGQGQWQNDIHLTGASELRKLGQKLQWMQQQLQSIEQQKDTFLRHVTHELKTPLASMVEGCNLLQEELVGPINEQQKDVLELISQNTERLKLMIQSLLNYNAIRSRIGVDHYCDIAQLQAQVEGHFKERLQAKSQTIDWHNPQQIAELELDAELVQMMLIQLVSNAIKFSPDGAVIKVDIAQAKGKVQLKVTDQGPGISQHEQSLLFDAFYQGEAAKKSPSRGSGLGLSIVRECAQHLGGEVSIDSAASQGSCFILSFNKKEK